MSGKKSSDGESISVKGRLTDKATNTLQNYCGMAIRQNAGNLSAMRKAVGAVLYHCLDIKDEEARHQFCPKVTQVGASGNLTKSQERQDAKRK